MSPSTEIVLKRAEVSQAATESLTHLLETGLVETGKVLKEAIHSPILQLIAGVALIEYLQTVWIVDYYKQVSYNPPAWEAVKKPLISDFMAGTMQTIMTTTTTLNMIGKSISLEDLLAIVK